MEKAKLACLGLRPETTGEVVDKSTELWWPPNFSFLCRYRQTAR